jgi:hypothetical protein
MRRLRALAAPLAVDLPLAGLVLVARWRLPATPGDDAAIVLAVVRNALAGYGPHLDPGSGDAVLSTLLWPAGVGALVAAGLSPLAALGALGLAAELLLVLVVRRLGETLSGSRAAGALAAAALATHPVLLLPALAGMETALVLALVAAGTLARARGDLTAAAGAAAVLPWLRFDSASAAAILLASSARAACRRGEHRAVVAGGAVAAGAFAAQWSTFGSWLPGSVTAKAATGGAGLEGAAAVALEFARAAAGRSAYWLVEATPHLLLVPAALAGLVRLGRERERRRRFAPLGLWAGVYVALFVGSGRAYATNFPWYFAPPLLPLAVLAAIGTAPLLGRVARLAPALAQALPALVVAGVGLGVAGPVERSLVRVERSFTDHRERAYAAAALWLARHGPAASVASNEIGTLAWRSPPGTAIVDLFGLSRRPAERGVDGVALALARRPEAIVTRIDFRWRRAIEAADPDGWIWVRAGSIDLGLEPQLARRLEPHAAELTRIYRELGRAGGAPQPVR